MKRRVSPFVVAIPAFILVAVFKVFPIIYSFILSLFNYLPRAGVLGSEFVGMDNYSEFFGSFYAKRVILNTIVLTVFPAILTALVSFLAILFILKLPNKWTRCLALTVLAIPAFIPTPVVIDFIRAMTDSGTMLVDWPQV